MMPKKSKQTTSANGNAVGSPQLSPINLAALRRCRPLLVKDLDVEELLRVISTSVDSSSSASDNTNVGTLSGLRWIESELRSPLLAVPDVEHRAAALLDSIESRADAVFSSFVDLLRIGDRNRKLYAVLHETLRALGGGETNSGDEDDGQLDDCGVFADRTSVPGESIRRLIQRCASRQQRLNAVKSSGSQTLNGSDNGELEPKTRSGVTAEGSIGDYVDCFTVATRGSRLQPEPWIKHAKASSSSLIDCVSQPFENTAVTTKDLVFRRLDRASLFTLSGVINLTVPPATFASVYVVDFDYKFVPTPSVAATQQEPLPAPRLQSTATTKATALTSVDGRGDTGDVSKVGCDAVDTVAVSVPPLPPKPPDLSLCGTQARPTNRNLPRPPLVPADPPVNDSDTVSIDEPQVEAPPLPERKLRILTSGKHCISDEDRVSLGSLKKDANGLSASSSPALTRRDVVKGVLQASAMQEIGTGGTARYVTGGSTTSDESDSIIPPQLPPRLYVTGSEKPVLTDENDSKRIADDLADKAIHMRLPTVVVPSSLKDEDNDESESNNSEEPEIDVIVDADSAEVLNQQNQPADVLASRFEEVSLSDSNRAAEEIATSLTSSQREDSGIGVSSSMTGSTDESHTEAESIDIPIERQSSAAYAEDDEQTLLYADDAIEEEVVAAPATEVDASGGSRRHSSTVDDGQGSFGSTVDDGSGEPMSSCVGGGLDSGVDSLQSLSRAAGTESTGSYQRHDADDDDRSADDGDNDDDACNEDNLSEIRIPAGDDDTDVDYDDNLDRMSEESISHYEDIELLPVENVYLDPRHPSDSSTPYQSSGMISIKKRRSEPSKNRSVDHNGSVRYGYSYSSPSPSSRHEEMLAELEATDRKFLVAGSVLILEDQETSVETEPTRNENSDVDAGDVSLTRCLRGANLGYDSRCLAFYVPSDSLRNHGDPVGERWFYPVTMTPRDATIFLRVENQPGCFVVYSPPKPLPSSVVSEAPLYYLSVCLGNGGDVVHYRIIRNPRGDVSISGHDHSFLNLADLVSYFRRNRSGLAVRLGRPLADASRGFLESTWSKAANRYALSRRELVLTSRSIRHQPIYQQIDLDVKFEDRGRFGKTYVGRYRGRPVAVAVMGRPDFSDSDHVASRSSFASRVDEFLEPALDVVAGLRHDNIVRLIGVSVSERPFYVVWEHSENGATLADRLRDGGIDGSGLGRFASDDVEALFDVCLQASAAVAYLESQRFILHRDIAARSFTVIGGMDGGGGRLIKLTNFDRARRVCDDDYQASLSETIFVRWAAPEVLVESRYSTKSDVWSLGVLFWEVFSSAATPFQRIESMEQLALLIARGRRVSASENCHLNRPSGPCPDDLWAIIRACWRHCPADRPSPGALYSRLKGGRSKIYAAITALDVTTTSSNNIRQNTSSGTVQNTTSGGLSSTQVTGMLNRNRRAMPLPQEPVENGGAPSSNLSYRFDQPTSVSQSIQNRPTLETPSAGNRWSASKESNRLTSDHTWDATDLVSPKTSVTHGQQRSLPPSSPSWETASMISSMTLGGYERTSLRHSFMNRLLPNHNKKKKKSSMTLNQTIEVTTKHV